MSKISLQQIYKRRWDTDNPSSKAAINRSNAWNQLVISVFQPLVEKSFATLDLGCGQGDFINRIQCKDRFAVDLDSSNSIYLNEKVKFINSSANNLGAIASDSIDFVFSSNMFEHLQNKEELFETLTEIGRVLNKKLPGKLLVMMPNISKVKMKFFDFIDHSLPLNENSLPEALELCGFQVEKVIPGFFPYSAVNSKFIYPRFIYWLYLHLPLKNRPLSGQMLILASYKPLKSN